MAPTVTLILITTVARFAGAMGISYVGSWSAALAVGLAAMFLLTASSHAIQPRRAGLIAIVPEGVPFPSLVVTITGVLEAVGAIGLLIPPGWIPHLRASAAVCLAVLLVTMFPANINAARSRRHPQSPHTPLPRRTAMQILFVAAAVTVAVTA